MKRLAVATIITLVALCTSAFGGYYTWLWNPELGQDSVWDANNQCGLYLTKNNGAYSVALGYSADSANYWTGVAADFRLTDEAGERESACAFEWMDTRRWGYGGSYPWPYGIWVDNPKGTIHNPSNACVVANDSYKFWMESDSDPDNDNSCARGATGLLTIHGVLYGNMFNGEPNQNSDHSIANLIFPDISQNMVGVFMNEKRWESTDSFGLNDKYSDSHGESWWYPIDGMVRIVPYGVTYRATQPSLAAGPGSDVYLAYFDSISGVVDFKISTDYGADGSWSDPALLGTGDHPCIAAVGQFVFVCWHGSDNKIHYKFSNDAGSDWQGEATINQPGEFSQTNVSAITCYQHPGQNPGILLVSAWSLNGYPLEFFTLGEQFTANQISWLSPYATAKTYNADLRPSVAAANYNGGDYVGRTVYNTQMRTGLCGFHLLRGAWAQDC